MKYAWIIGPLAVIFTMNLCAQTVTWRGENFSGKFEAENLMKEWPQGGPQKLIQVDGIGKGWGTVLLTNNRYYATGRKDSIDYLSCFDDSGNRIWEQSIGLSWHRSFPDSRSTPTVDGDRVYALSGRGNLNCLNAKDGTKIWTMNVDSVFEASWHNWGVAESPLVVGDKVFSVPAGDMTTIVALDKMTGELIWKSEPLGHQRSYASPVLLQTDSIQQVVGITTRSVFGVDLETGIIQWEYPLSERIAEIKKEDVSDKINANPAIVKGNSIYVAQGYDNISVMLELSPGGEEVRERWVDRTLDCHHGGVVEFDGYIYGSNWYGNRDGVWVCLDWETGEVYYVTRWINKGVTLFADGLLYLYEEKEGSMAICKPGKEGMEIISSFKADFGEGQHWAHPFIADGKLIIRHGESFAVYNLSQDL